MLVPKDVKETFKQVFESELSSGRAMLVATDAPH